MYFAQKVSEQFQFHKNMGQKTLVYIFSILLIHFIINYT